MVQGDACEPPAGLAIKSFDLIYSNSVIEHVGGHHRRQQFAQTVYELGDHHWIQTPYRYFPVEPHWLFPAFQFLPLAIRTELSARWPLGWMRHIEKPPQGYEENLPYALEVELLSRAEMAYYFPQSAILSEKFAGLTKSLIASG
jgi:hypothetical protein